MYDAKVLDVLIASPSDTNDQRAAIRDTVIRWNETEPRHFGVVLLPVLWESHTYPDMSGPPQPIINKQIVDRADIVIATFWTTVGSQTADAESGTIEEIERSRKAGKHVLVYFCDMPIAPLDTDTTALEALRAYKDRIKGEGLFSSYSTIEELREKVRRDLTRLVHDKTQSGEVVPTEHPKDAERTPAVVSERTEAASALDAIRAELRGFVAKWQSIVGSFPGDYSVDTRQSLATEVERVILGAVQQVATVAHEAPVIQELSAVANDARAVASITLYLDGGKSFGELSDGCIELVQRVSDLVQREWTPTP